MKKCPNLVTMKSSRRVGNIRKRILSGRALVIFSRNSGLPGQTDRSLNKVKVNFLCTNLKKMVQGSLKMDQKINALSKEVLCNRKKRGTKFWNNHPIYYINWLKYILANLNVIVDAKLFLDQMKNKEAAVDSVFTDHLKELLGLPRTKSHLWLKCIKLI